MSFFRTYKYKDLKSDVDNKSYFLQSRSLRLKAFYLNCIYLLFKLQIYNVLR